MRYIDADALIRYGKCDTLVYWEDIENAPSIDIVRCRECKYWSKQDKRSPFYRGTDCIRYGGMGMATADDFCSYGERSE